MLRRRYLFLAALIAGFSFESLGAVVTTTSDDGAGSLRAAIRSAEEGETITIEASLSGRTIALTSGELVVGKALSVDGSGLAVPVVISGNGRSRVFRTQAGVRMALSNVTLANGVAEGYGGALLNYGTVVLSNCVVSGNTMFALASAANSKLEIIGGSVAENDGGILCQRNSSVVVRDSLVATNSVEPNFLNGVLSEEATLAVVNTRFSKGALAPLVEIRKGSAKFFGCEFADSEAQGAGGAISNQGGEVEIVECNFRKNISYDVGGAVHNSGKMVIYGSEFIENGASWRGGAIDNSGSELFVIDSTFRRNRAGEEGGAVGNLASATIRGSLFESNSSRGFYGGAIVNHGSLRTERSTLTGNLGYLGGAIYNDGVLEVEHCTIARNYATLNFDPSFWGQGAGICTDDGAEVRTGVTNSIVAGNITRSGRPEESVEVESNFWGEYMGANNSSVKEFLGALADNGGPTKTIALLDGSPAMNAGIASEVALDQRGRRQLGPPDIGAYEWGGESLQKPTVTSSVDLAAGIMRFNFESAAGAAFVALMAEEVEAGAAMWRPGGVVIDQAGALGRFEFRLPMRADDERSFVVFRAP